MEEDEDVLLEGSSLYQHLQETGFTDFEVISPQNKRKEFLNNVNEIDRESEHKNTEKWSSNWIKKTTLNCLGLPDLEDYFLKSMSLKIVQTRLLEEEDLLILETLSPNVERLCSESQLFSKEGVTQQQSSHATGFYKKTVLFYFIYAVALWLILTLANHVPVIGWAVGIGLFLLCAFYLYRFRNLRTFTASMDKMKRILDIIVKTSSLSKRGLKFLNEINIIRRGIKQKIDTLDISEYSHETALSEGTNHLLTLVSSLLQASHAQLATSAQFGLDNVHSLFSERFRLEGKWKEVDGSASSCLAGLKTKRNLVTVQSSAFLTELLLSFEFSRDFRLFLLLTDEKCVVIESKIILLDRLLNLARKFWLKEEPSLKTVLNPLKNYEKSKVDVQTVVNALAIHCRVLAYSGIYLRESLEDGSLKKEPEMCRQIIDQSCEDIKNEIVSCNACLEEVVERSEYLFGPKQSGGDENETKFPRKVEEQTTTATAQRAPLQTYGLSDPVIVDEVFEGTVDPHERTELRTKEDKSLIRNEKQMKKKQRERCRRVLQEIQPILQRRREMWSERESKALRRMNNADVAEVKAGCGDSGLGSPTSGGVWEKSPLDADNVSVLLAEDSTRDTGDVQLKTGVINNDVNESKETRTCDLDFDTEYDSEEERILVYKRVKRELEEDEERRRREEEDEEESDASSDSENQSRFVINRKKLFALSPPAREDGLLASSTTDSDRDAIAQNAIRNTESGVANGVANAVTNGVAKSIGDISFPVSLREETDASHQRDELTPSEDLLSSQSLETEDADWEIVERSGSKMDIPDVPEDEIVERSGSKMDIPDVPDILEDETFRHSETRLTTEDLVATTLRFSLQNQSITTEEEGMDDQLSYTKGENECFSCGDDDDDEKEKVIDWSSCGFTNSCLRRGNKDEIAFSGLPPSFLNSDVILRRRTKLLGKEEEEVFGGVGEGEEEESESERECGSTGEDKD